MGKFNRVYKFLLSAVGLNFITNIFTNIFLVSHLFNNSVNGISTVANFYIITYITIMLVFSIFSVLLKRINKVYIFRLGIVFKLIFSLLLLILYKDIIENIILLAIFYGISEAIYWSSFNSMRNEIVEKSKLHTFVSYQNILDYFVKITVPALLGFLIDLSSFAYVTIFIVVITAVQLISTLFIKNDNVNIEKFSLRDYFACLKNTHSFAIFKKLYLNFFLNGVTKVIPVLVVYVTIITYKTNTSLGVITSLVAIICILFMLLFKKHYVSKKHKSVILFSVALAIVGVSPLFFDINKTILIIFNLLFTSFILLPNTLTDINRGYIIQKYNLNKYIVENSAVVEVFLNIGRITGFLMMMFVGLNFSQLSFKLLLGVQILLVLLFGYVVSKIEKHLGSLD